MGEGVIGMGKKSAAAMSTALVTSFFLLFSCTALADSDYIVSLSEEPLYTANSPDSITAAAVAPQKLTILEEKDGFYRISTWLGDRWIHPAFYMNSHDEQQLRLTQNTALHAGDSFDSPKDGELAPQVVTVQEKQGDWYRIDSYLGDRWVTLQDEPQPKKAVKAAYLTFDDGPSASTNDLMDVLDSYKVKATFFMIETNMRARQQAVARINDDGDYIGLHSVTHDVKKVYASPAALVNEMNTTHDTLLNLTGADHHLVRVPYGSKPYMTQSFRDAIVDAGYKMWDWTIDSYDWEYGETDSQRVLQEIKNQLPKVERDQKPVVILMHDRKATVKIVPQVIEYLQSQGYDLQTYDEKEHQSVNFWKDNRL